MKILIWSKTLHPSVGGVEFVSDALSRHFVRRGHPVRVITETPGRCDDRPYVILRTPTPLQVLREVRTCDAFLMNNLSLTVGWSVPVSGRPCIAAVHDWQWRAHATRGDPLVWVKRALTRHCSRVAISRAIARHLPGPSRVIPEPYDDGRFRTLAGGPRDRDIIFVARLIRDKGGHHLLQAAARLPRGPTLTIAGAGPEEARLRALVSRLGMNDRVRFLGVRDHDDLVRVLNRHRILVVPSVYPEPFGIVALEGAACGCFVIGSDGGGLPDAIGPSGVTYPIGNTEALAAVLDRALSSPSGFGVSKARVREHLQRHTRAAVGDAYLGLIQSLVDRT